MFFYGIMQLITFSSFNVIEYAVKKDDKQAYPFDTMRVFTYTGYQYFLLIMCVAADLTETLFSVLAF